MTCLTLAALKKPDHDVTRAMAELTLQTANDNSPSLGQLAARGATVGFLLWQTWHINRVQQGLFGNQLFTLISLVPCLRQFSTESRKSCFLLLLEYFCRKCSACHAFDMKISSKMQHLFKEIVCEQILILLPGVMKRFCSFSPSCDSMISSLVVIPMVEQIFGGS